MGRDTTADDSAPVEVPPEVYRQLETLRESGLVNMYMDVKRGLRELEFDTALEWVDDHPDQYVNGFFRGFEPAEEPDDETDGSA